MSVLVTTLADRILNSSSSSDPTLILFKTLVKEFSPCCQII